MPIEIATAAATASVPATGCFERQCYLPCARQAQGRQTLLLLLEALAPQKKQRPYFALPIGLRPPSSFSCTFRAGAARRQQTPLAGNNKTHRMHCLHVPWLSVQRCRPIARRLLRDTSNAFIGIHFGCTCTRLIKLAHPRGGVAHALPVHGPEDSNSAPLPHHECGVHLNCEF